MVSETKYKEFIAPAKKVGYVSMEDHWLNLEELKSIIQSWNCFSNIRQTTTKKGGIKRVRGL